MTEIKEEATSELTCRLCLTENDDSQLIFGSDSTALDEWIGDLISLKIIYVPEAPGSLCLSCKQILENFEDFRKTCFLNNKIFNEQFVQIDRSEKCDLENCPEEMLTLNMTNNYLDNNDDSTGAIESVIADPLNSPKTIIEKGPLKIETSDDSAAEHATNLTEEPAAEQKQIPKLRGQKLCPVCNTYVSSLGQHVRNAHKEYQPFQCEYCSKRFNANGNLLKHIRRHLQQKTHICKYCNKGFTNTGDLRVHIRMHTNEKPYKCNMCEKSFKTSSVLIKHKKFHQDIRTHTCEVCQAKFVTAYHLKRHKKLHTLEWPYNCEFCGERISSAEAASARPHKCADLPRKG